MSDEPTLHSGDEAPEIPSDLTVTTGADLPEADIVTQEVEGPVEIEAPRMLPSGLLML